MCLLFIVCCGLFVVRGLLLELLDVAVCVVNVMFVAWCSLRGARCVLFVVVCLSAVCRSFLLLLLLLVIVHVGIVVFVGCCVLIHVCC